MEELLGYLADRIGLDLRTMSAGRRVLAVSFYMLVGLALLVGGLLAMWTSSDNWAVRLSGGFCALLGAAWIARIVVSIFTYLRAKPES